MPHEGRGTPSGIGVGIDAESQGEIDSRRAVAVALGVDLLIAAGKAVAFVLSGSVSVLAELFHSLADVLNQTLLMVGIVRSRRDPDESHPYGFGRARYVWAMLSAAGVLFLGSGMSLIEGTEQLIGPEPLGPLTLAIIILGLSALAESVSLTTGILAVRQSAKDEGTHFFAYLRGGPDPTAVAVVMEDASAVLGAVLALVAVLLTEWTGNGRWDGAGSIAVGLLLAGSAVFLINRNRLLLLDIAPPEDQVRRMVELLEAAPAVAEVRDVKVTRLGADRVRFKAEITFDGRALAEQLVEKEDLEALFAEITGPKALGKVLVDFGGRLTDELGDEIDRVEGVLTAEFPEAEHVDLEPD